MVVGCWERYRGEKKTKREKNEDQIKNRFEIKN